MIKYFCLALALCFVFLTTACTQPFRSGPAAICQQACLHEVNICQKSCRNSCRQCTAFGLYTAKQSWNTYVHETLLKGERVTRNLNSYRDPLQCRKTTCSCAADYTVCMQTCGGIIIKKLKVPTVC